MFFPSLIPGALKNRKAPDIHCLCICINSWDSGLFSDTPVLYDVSVQTQ